MRKNARVKRIGSLLLAFVMILSLAPMSAKAAAKNEVPEKVRLHSESEKNAIEIVLADQEQSIAKIQTSSKNLIAKQTTKDYNWSDTGEARNKYAIGLICKKDGTYTVSFDIVDKDNKKVESKKVTVYAYPTPLKSCTINGKNYGRANLTGTSGKVKVALASGNTIKKLEYGVYQLSESKNSSSTKMVYKTFKNGGKVTFGKVPYTYSYKSESDYYVSDFQTMDLGCPTTIKITYYDKYTKQNEVIEEWFSKYPDK